MKYRGDTKSLLIGNGRNRLNWRHSETTKIWTWKFPAPSEMLGNQRWSVMNTKSWYWKW